MKFKFLLLAIVASVSSAFGQYPAQNFTLLSVIDPEVGTGSKYSGCWGWVQPGTGKEYAIACSEDGTYWVDVTNPTSPTVCAYAPGTSTNCTWREVKTYQNYAYVVSDQCTPSSFQIFDMSALPATVTTVYNGSGYFKWGHAAWIDGSKLYVSGVTYTNSAFDELNVYSLATPSAPVLLRRLSQDYPAITGAHDAFVKNDTVFFSAGYQGLHVYRFLPSNTFTALGSLTSYTAAGYNHSSALTPNGQTLVFMDEVPNGLPIKVADATNLGNIQVLSTTNQYTQTTPHNPFIVSNQYCFVSSYRDGTQLLDISNPNAPFFAGYFDTYPQGGGNNNNWAGSAYDGQWGCYPFFPSKNIFALDQYNGIFMFNTHLYANPDINLQGNSNNIADGTIVTSTLTATEYGTVMISTSLTHTFVVQNTGLANLNVSNISFTGSNASEFSVSPASFSVVPSGSLIISVVFTPTATGTRSAQVNIVSNDYNETVYDFVVSGEGRPNTTSIETITGADFRFFVYPNPVKNEVQFNVPKDLSNTEIMIEVYDVTGKIVISKNIGKTGEVRNLTLSDLNNGVYTFNVLNEGKTIASKKIVVSK